MGCLPLGSQTCNYYYETLGAIYTSNRNLECLFPDSVWAAMSFNFGPETCCYRHKDWGNLAFGICVITNTGNFDPTRGGHLILWKCGLIIEFPPGSSIMVPSTVISHSNIPIQPSETHYSFTQYAAGGLFRWVEHGFQKEGRYNRDLSAEEQAEEQFHREKCKDFGLLLFSTLNELCHLPHK
jgi:hypothetical protein